MLDIASTFDLPAAVCDELTKVFDSPVLQSTYKYKVLTRQVFARENGIGKAFMYSTCTFFYLHDYNYGCDFFYID